MGKSFKSIPEAGIFKPGDLYIFYEDKDPGYDPGPIEFMYFIRSEDEIMPALRMEIEQVLWFRLKNFLGCTKISDTCYELKMECYDPEEGDIQYSLFLHRIKTVQETMREVYKGP